MDSIGNLNIGHDNNATNASNSRAYQVKNDRMGGFVPSWDGPKNSAKNTDYVTFGNNDAVLSYQKQMDEVNITPLPEQKEFGFTDLLDMVNPLQHIPLVNIAYRELTGDDIKPIGKIIGGAIFGGPAGAASGLLNVALEEETGRGVMGTATSFAASSSFSEIEKIAYDDLPIALLEFAQLPILETDTQTEDNFKNNDYERVSAANGRTAGTIASYA